MLMKKKLTPLFLALVMCMTMSAPAFAVESTSVAAMEKAAYEDAVRADIMRQLEAQDATELYDIFESIFLPEQEETILPMADEDIPKKRAPEGGIAYYKIEDTYRGEECTFEYVDAHCDAAQTEVLIETWNATLLMWNVMIKVYGAPFMSALGAAQRSIYWAAKAGTSLSKSLIEDAGGYARIVTVLNENDASTATVTGGWYTYPWIYPESGAKDISYSLYG